MLYYAVRMEIYANNVIIGNSSPEFYDMLTEYRLSDRVSFNMYYSDEHEKIGVLYEQEYSSMDLYYRYDDNEFKCIEDYDISDMLELPSENGYLEGYIVVYDKFGMQYESNIVTFSGIGGYSERFKDSDGDRVADAYEIRDLKTNPFEKDSDGDGIIDSYDLYQENEDKYYGVSINLYKEVYEYLSDDIASMYACKNEKNIDSKGMVECHLKQSKTDDVVRYYDEENRLVTIVGNKITGNEILRYNEDGYTHYVYDNHGRKVAVIANDGSNDINNVYKYDENGQLVEIIHNGFSYSLTYCGNNLQQIDIGNSVYVKYETDDSGNVTQISYANGYKCNMEYDKLGNILKVSDSSGVLYEWSYGLHYRLEKHVDYVNGRVTYYSYDEMEELKKVEDDKGNYIEYTYDEYGVDKKYGFYSEVYTVSNFNGDVSSLSEFDNGLKVAQNLDSEEDTKKTYSYERTTVVDIIEKCVDNCMIKTVGIDEYKYVFDNNGNLVEEHINGELTTSYEYDAGGNVITESFYELSFDIETEELGAKKVAQYMSMMKNGKIY